MREHDPVRRPACRGHAVGSRRRMVQKLLSRLRSSGVDPRLLILLMVNGVLGQTVIALARVTTSYRAIELGLSVVWVGAIATVFALFPIGMACAGLVVSDQAATLFAWTSVLGVGHLFLMSSQQMLCVRCGGQHRMEQ